MVPDKTFNLILTSHQHPLGAPLQLIMPDTSYDFYSHPPQTPPWCPTTITMPMYEINSHSPQTTAWCLIAISIAPDIACTFTHRKHPLSA